MKWRCVRDVEGIPGLALRRQISPRMHRVIVKAAERCERIVTHPHEFPELQNMFPKLTRARRIERRIGMALSIQSHMVGADIPSRRSGIYDAGTLRGISVVALAAEWTGLANAGEPDNRGRRGRRAERACADINRAGYESAKPDKLGRLRAPQPIDRETLPNGQRRYTGLPAIRQISKLFIRRIGMTIEWELAVKNAKKKREAEAQNTDDRDQVARVLNTPIKRRPIVDPDVDPEAARNKVLIPIIFEVKAAHPDWSGPDQRAEAERIYAARQRGTGPPE